MATLAFSQAMPLTIRVLEAPLRFQELMIGQPLGQVSLEGRSLPYRPIVYEGRQRVKTTWYAGNTSATQQVMGAVLEPTTLTGMWKDKYLGDGAARAFCVLFDTIRKVGAPVEVTWGAGFLDGTVFGGQFVRRGIIARTKWTFDRPQDVAWEMEFHWSSEGETTAPILVSVGVENPREGFTGMVQSMLSVVDDVAAFRENPITRVVNLSEDITTGLDLIANKAIEVTQIIDNAAAATSALADIPRHIVERAIDVAQKVNLTLKGLEETMLNIKDMQYETKDDAKQLLEYLGARLSIVQASTEARELAVETGSGLTGQLYPEVLAEVRPPAGTDLRDLAFEFYGDPDLWFIIAQYNGLISSRTPSLPDGASDNPFGTRPLLIPLRQEGSLGDIRAGC